MATSEKRRRGRAKPWWQRQGEQLDRLINDVLKHGQPIFDPRTGEPVLDVNGEPVLRAPSAAFLEVCRKRIADAAGAQLSQSQRGMSPQEQLLDNIRDRVSGMGETEPE